MVNPMKNEKTFNVHGAAKEILNGFPKGSRVTVTPTKGGFIVRRAPLSRQERHNLAVATLRTAEGLAYTEFANVWNCVMAVYKAPDGRTRTGVAICAPDDVFDLSVGRLIAFERAKYGKVVTCEIL